VDAGEISAHGCDVGLIQAGRHRPHQFSGIVFSRAFVEGLERTREIFRRLTGQIRCRMSNADAVRSMMSLMSPTTSKSHAAIHPRSQGEPLTNQRKSVPCGAGHHDRFHTKVPSSSNSATRSAVACHSACRASGSAPGDTGTSGRASVTEK
jgi:hypothetical protein